MAFCKVIEGKMASAYGARPMCANEFGLKFNSYDFNGDPSGTVRCPAGHRTMCKKSKGLSKISKEIGRWPSGHRPIFY